MEWTTHALSGLAVGYLISNDWKCAVVGAIASIIPDIDEPKSKFGRPLFFISIPINELFGHRTFTHSLLFVLLMFVVTYSFSPSISFATMAGISAHIIGDMITGRVRLLYPHKAKIGVNVSRFGYRLIDFTTRFSLTLIIGIVLWKKAF